MKLYGKRMVALVLTLAMTLSVCSMSVFAAAETFDIEYSMEYTGNSRYDEIDLCTLVAEELEYEYRTYDIDVDPYDVEIDMDGLDLYYGYIGDGRNDYGYYTIDLTTADEAELEKKGYLYEVDIPYSAIDDYNDEYEGDIALTITIYNNDLEYDLAGDTEFELGKALIDDLDKLMTETLNYVDFELDADNDCGDLCIYDSYEDEWVDFSEREVYYYLPSDRYDYDLEDLIFEHDGSEGEFVIYYTAYGTRNEEIEGIITIICDGALFFEDSISNEEVYNFDSELFQDAVDEWDDAYTLVYIDNVKLADSSDGTLYYDYDEDSRRNTEISSKSEYYVDDNEEQLLDYITFVPKAGLKDTVTIHFDAYVEKGRSDDTIAGVLKIEVEQAADITIKADLEEEVELDYDLFQEYLEEDLDSTKYDVAYVTISNAPRSKDAGYLVTDDEELTTRGDKTFYMDPTSKQYSLKDLNYLAGEKKGTYSATFTVYYYAKATSKTASASSEGTIDFVIGSDSSTGSDKINSINFDTPMLAAKGMSFADTKMLTALKSLGGKDNLYVVFTSLPVGGKLYYGYGTSAQEDIQIGTAYYFDYSPVGRQLNQVSFVPNYSSSKVPQTISFYVNAYDKNSKASIGMISLNVTYANRSAYFTDVTTSTYADSVDYLYNRKIANGMTSTTFGPAEKVTRGQFVTFLWRAAGSPTVYGNTSFTDIKSSDYYYDAIRWAVQKGITTGRTATTFDPIANVTYQEMAIFLYRYDVNLLGHAAGSTNLNGFSDANQVDSWALSYVQWAAHKKILTGTSIKPVTAATRADVALWLHRMLTL